MAVHAERTTVKILPRRALLLRGVELFKVHLQRFSLCGGIWSCLAFETFLLVVLGRTIIGVSPCLLAGVCVIKHYNGNIRIY